MKKANKILILLRKLFKPHGTPERVSGKSTGPQTTLCELLPDLSNSSFSGKWKRGVTRNKMLKWIVCNTWGFFLSVFKISWQKGEGNVMSGNWKVGMVRGGFFACLFKDRKMLKRRIQYKARS